MDIIPGWSRTGAIIWGKARNALKSRIKVGAYTNIFSPTYLYRKTCVGYYVLMKVVIRVDLVIFIRIKKIGVKG